MKKIVLLIMIVGTTLMAGCKSEAVKNTETAISSIGTVNLESQLLIEEAQKKYDSLTETQKNQVSNYQELLDAQEIFSEFKYVDLAEKIYNKIEESEFDFETKIEFFSEIILTSYIFNAENIRAIASSTDSAPIQIRNEAEELYNEFDKMSGKREELKKAVDEYYASYGQLCDLLLDYNFTQANFGVLADSYSQNYQIKKENLKAVIDSAKKDLV